MSRSRQNGAAVQHRDYGRRQNSTDNQGDDIPDLEYRIRSIFNDVDPPDMREKLKEFLDDTSLENRGDLFTQAMYLAQHRDALGEYSDGTLRDPEIEWEREHAARQSVEGEQPDRHHTSAFPQDDPARSLRTSWYDQKIIELDAAPVKKPRPRGQRWPRLSWPEFQKWHALPDAVWHVVLVCGIGATVQGIDQAVVNGAQGLYLAAFNIQIGIPRNELLSQNPGKAGFINAAPYLCCVVSCWFTPWLNYRFGRRGTIFLCALFSVFFAFAQAFAQTWQQLVAFRLLMGLGIGPKSATIPIYAAETAPANIRGSLVTCWQAFTALGIAMGCAFSTILHQWGQMRATDSGSCNVNFLDGENDSQHQGRLLRFECSWNWRVILASPMILPIFLAFLIYFCRESPRWTISKAHELHRRGQKDRAQYYYRKAYRDLEVLSRSSLLAARDMFIHFFQLREEYKIIQKARDNPFQTWWGFKWTQLFGQESRRNRRAITASTVCMIAQQLCGVNILIYYSNFLIGKRTDPTPNDPPEVYNQAALLHTMGFGIINFVFALPAYLLIDMMGRRTLLLTTFPLLAFSHLIMAVSSALPGKHGESMFLAGFYIFGIFYSPGEGPVPFVYASESMPLSIRAEGMGIVTSINWFFNWLVAFTAPYLFTYLKGGGTFSLYAAFCAVLWFLILLLVPETRLLTLEQLSIVFEKKSAKEFAEHAINSLKYRLGLGKNPGSLYESEEEAELLTRQPTIDEEAGMNADPQGSISNQLSQMLSPERPAD